MMNIAIHETLTCQVLVIGAGGAGIRAALTAAQDTDNILLISETAPGDSGSTFYPLTFEWGMLSSAGESDTRQFTQEILTAAKGCINPKLAAYLAEGSNEARERFIREGLPLVPMKELNITGCFGKEPRGDFLTDLDTFVSSQRQLVQQNEHITFAQLTAVSLLVRDGCCAGAIAVDAQGHLVQINAHAVVLALGGAEGLYEHRASFGALYGNAYAMAARHQARLVNLEFIQFVPGTVTPVAYMNYYPFLLNEHPRVTNARDEECMERYLPSGVTLEECLDMHAKHGPFSCEDNGKYLEYAMVGEDLRGAGRGLKLWPDTSRLQSKRALHWRNFLQRLGYNEGTVMQVYPMAQGFNGGILLHDDLSTDIEGLYACGESSGGLHGPDRMGGLCILATQVFGKGAGQNAVNYASKRKMHFFTSEEAAQVLVDEFASRTESDLTPQQVLARIRHEMQENACLRRNEKGLGSALYTMEQLGLQPLAHLSQPDTAVYFQVANALDASRLILTAMRNRKESRGSHDRSDYPGHDPQLAAMRWVSMEDGHIVHGSLPEIEEQK